LTAAHLTRARMTKQLMALRLEGQDYRAIGKRLGIDLSTAFRIFRDTLAAIPRVEADAARKESLERIAMIRCQAWARMKKSPSETGPMLGV
jgi:hypothetical protein